MRNADGSPHTALTTNLVHVIYVAGDSDEITVRDGILADIAPTLLAMLGVFNRSTRPRAHRIGGGGSRFANISG